MATAFEPQILVIVRGSSLADSVHFQLYGTPVQLWELLSSKWPAPFTLDTDVCGARSLLESVADIPHENIRCPNCDRLFYQVFLP